MKIKGNVVVVTGGANGIGEGLCRRFVADGAAGVMVADLDEARARKVAGQIGASAVGCDVAREADIVQLVRQTEATFGPIDIFCSNAGIIVKGIEDAADAEWQKIWQINVMAHVYAARAVIPGMLRRGGGAFVITASAAGLLSQIDSAPYSVTKHAAVGFAENLAINYGDRGLQVIAVCPMAVRTLMTRQGGGVAALDGMLEPDEVAGHVVDALADERFLVLPHPEVREYMRRKADDTDRWIRGMQRVKARFLVPGH
jgi:NAD(P)-dependent dehydrogenase (short-subunit alcohol dehydrogenase family)